MKLWLLERKDADYEEDDALLVRAASEKKARAIGRTSHVSFGFATDGKGLYPNGSTCVEVTAEGEPGILLRSNLGA